MTSWRSGAIGKSTTPPKGCSIENVQVPLELDAFGHATDLSEDTGDPLVDDFNDPDRSLDGD